ncbi:MAG: hypothetical protein ABIF71_12085 [Planctomycetota bacterium]
MIFLPVIVSWLISLISNFPTFRLSDMLQTTIDSNAKLEDNLMETKREEVDLQQDVCRILGA